MTPEAEAGTRPEVVIPALVVVRLAHVVVAHALREAGVDGLVVKGLAAQGQGLGLVRVPSDVDVLVRPGGEEALVAVLRARGWRERPQDADEWAFPRHSVSLWHEGWSCDIDVHFLFPGLGDDPVRAFEALWGRREPFDVGPVVLHRPGRADALVVGVVHALRNVSVDRHRRELGRLALDAADIGAPAVVSAARASGATPYVAPFLEDVLGVQVVDPGTVSEQWRLRTELSSSARRLVVFRRLTWRERPAFVRAVLFPPAGSVVKSTTAVPPRGVRLLVVHAGRWARGLRAVPRAVVESLAYRGTS